MEGTDEHDFAERSEHHTAADNQHDSHWKQHFTKEQSVKLKPIITCRFDAVQVLYMDSSCSLKAVDSHRNKIHEGEPRPLKMTFCG